MKTITREMAEKVIHATDGKIFSVGFTKNDGSHRDMVCRLGVKVHLKGGELSYDPSEFEMIPVFDCQKQAYRMIKLDTLTRLTFGGETYEVV